MAQWRGERTNFFSHCFPVHNFSFHFPRKSEQITWPQQRVAGNQPSKTWPQFSCCQSPLYYRAVMERFPKSRLFCKNKKSLNHALWFAHTAGLNGWPLYVLLLSICFSSAWKLCKVWLTSVESAHSAGLLQALDLGHDGAVISLGRNLRQEKSIYFRKGTAILLCFKLFPLVENVDYCLYYGEWHYFAPHSPPFHSFSNLCVHCNLSKWLQARKK